MVYYVLTSTEQLVTIQRDLEGSRDHVTDSLQFLDRLLLQPTDSSQGRVPIHSYVFATEHPT